MLTESASINLAAYRLEIDKTRRPWEKKYLLSPEDRKLKRTYEKEVDAIKESAAAVIKSADLKDSQAFELYKKGNKLLPFIELNNFISTNYKQKVDAARHKAVLLERMTIHEFKTSLHGAALDGAQTGLSAESMTAIANLMVLKKKEAVYVPFLEDAQRQIELEMEKIRLAAEESRRQEQALRGTFRKSQYIPNPVDISRRPVRPRPVRTLPKLQSSSMQKKSIMSASLTSLPRRQQVTSQGSASTGFSEPSEDCIQVAKQIHSPNMTDDDVVSLSD